EINIEVNGALFTVKNKSNLRLQLTVLTKLSCRWITHNYVLHSMPADFELGVADVGVALAAATAASSGHWMDQILKTHCSLLIYESIFEETTQPLFTIARGGYGASRSNTPAGNTVGRWLKERRKKQETRAHNAQLHAMLFVVGVAATVATFTATTTAASTSRKKLSVSVKSILNRLDRGRNSSLSEMQVETELSPGLRVFGSVGIGRLAHQTLEDQLQEAADMSAILTVVTLGMFYAVVAKTAFNGEGQQSLHHL
ncbi:putative CPA1 family protein, partial [Tanacetum coccineum]